MHHPYLRLAALFALLALTGPALAQRPGGKKVPVNQSPMPVYVTPFYNSKGPEISVGKYSEQLAAADAKSIDKLLAELDKEQATLPAEVMYVAAIRLYDLGRKDEATYWFYAAQYRGRLFTALLDPAAVGGIGSPAFERKQAYNAFNQLAGVYINGYAFGQLPMLEKSVQRVIDESKTLPDFAAAHPEVKFIPQDQWPAKNEGISAGLTKMLDYIKTNADTIRAQRKASGIEGKY
jgi:hypothetical protein